MRRGGVAIVGPLVLLALVGLALWSMQREADASEEAVDGGAKVPVLAPLRSPERESATPTGEPPPDTESVTTEVEQGRDDQLDEDDLMLAGEHIEHDGPADPEGAVLEPRDEDQAAEFEEHKQVAVEFLQAYARPGGDVSEEHWWQGVRDRLTEQAQADYVGVDPQLVPFTEVTGQARLVPVDAPAHLLRLVQVPTDAGDYLVSLQTDEDGIKIIRITPVAQEGDQSP